LRPERDIQGEGEFQGRLRGFVGQDGHGSGMQITGDQLNQVYLPHIKPVICFN
jgi:hypothetical protein